MASSNNDIVHFLLDVIRAAHEREPFVGGLFNAYEPAVHYEIFTAALRHELWDTWQEAPLGQGQSKCDLVLPLASGDRLWLEVKMWWFLNKAYKTPYVMQPKTLTWPLADWERLAHLRAGDHRALLLLRIWDDEAAKEQADRWFGRLDIMMREAEAPHWKRILLKRFSYSGMYPHAREGDVTIWSTTSRAERA